MSIFQGPRTGDLLPVTGTYKVRFDDLTVGYGAQRGHLSMHLYLGTWPKDNVANFDAAAALRRLGYFLETDDHSDDFAVSEFATAMKEKLAKSREKGRGGWDDPKVCTTEQLADLFVGHLGKGNDGNFLDLANFCMMLHQRGDSPQELVEALQRVYQPIAQED